MSGKVILTDYKHDPKEGNTLSKWLVTHTSRQLSKRILTLEQDVTLETDRWGKCVPTVALDDFPQGLSEREAMLKLADWLHRISVSIEDHWSTP
ncbi:hypothetical protein AAGW04_06925 [Pectobacterium aroidearum]|uniref:hypothetical protein n=1 Tax=Pectobacterium aroidearum TaxID=1201031 RepID=UPI0031598D23